MGRIVKFRLVTYFNEAPNQVHPKGDPVLVEKYASMGEEIDLRPIDEKRLDDLGALYTADEAKAVRDGSYRGEDAALLFQSRQGIRPASTTGSIEPADGEHGDFASMDSAQLAEYMVEHELNVKNTLALLPESATADDVNKLLDAEGIASEGEPRKGVAEPLDAKLAELSQS